MKIQFYDKDNCAVIPANFTFNEIFNLNTKESIPLDQFQEMIIQKKHLSILLKEVHVGNLIMTQTDSLTIFKESVNFTDDPEPLCSFEIDRRYNYLLDDKKRVGDGIGIIISKH